MVIGDDVISLPIYEKILNQENIIMNEPYKQDQITVDKVVATSNLPDGKTQIKTYYIVYGIITVRQSDSLIWSLKKPLSKPFGRSASSHFR